MTYSSFDQRRLPDTFRMSRIAAAPRIVVYAPADHIWLRNCVEGIEPLSESILIESSGGVDARKSIVNAADTSTIAGPCNASFGQIALSLPSCTADSESCAAAPFRRVHLPGRRPAGTAAGALPKPPHPLYLSLADRSPFLIHFRSTVSCRSERFNPTAGAAPRPTVSARG